LGAIAMSLVGLEAAWRAWHRSPPSQWARQLQILLLLVMGVTIAGGLGLLAGGARPRELLHFVYATVALSVLPIIDWWSRRSMPRTRGIATVAAAVITLAVVVRLFQTG
jgi:hypothetical protein